MFEFGAGRVALDEDRCGGGGEPVEAEGEWRGGRKYRVDGLAVEWELGKVGCGLGGAGEEGEDGDVQFVRGIVILVGLEVVELGERLGYGRGNGSTWADQQRSAAAAIAGFVEQVRVEAGGASLEGGLGGEPHLVVLVLE